MDRLAWVDEYVARVREYVFVRTEDNILIKRPNQAFRLNAAAARLLDRLFNRGEKVADLVEGQPERERVIGDLEVFFRDLRCLLTHGLSESHRSRAVRVVPFDYHFSRYPILSEIAITYRCNLKCRFCYAGCNCTRGAVGDRAELDLAGVKRVLEILRCDARVPSVSFTGGEPTLRGDLPEMISHARGLGLRVNLITNGAGGDGARVEALVAAGLNSAQVSLEGPTAEVHEAVTCVRGSFERTVGTLKAFQRSGIVVHTNTTLNRLNVESAADMPGFARSLGLERLSMNLMIPAGSGRAERELVIPYSEVGMWVERVREAAARAGVEFMWYSPTPLCVFNPIARGLGNKGCAACDGLVSVAPNGDVLPCSSYDEPVGNVLSEGFEAVWFGSRARFFREKEFAPCECRGCEDFAACQGACPLYWREMGFEEIAGIAKKRRRRGEIKACGRSVAASPAALEVQA